MVFPVLSSRLLAHREVMEMRRGCLIKRRRFGPGLDSCFLARVLRLNCLLRVEDDSFLFASILWLRLTFSPSQCYSGNNKDLRSPLCVELFSPI